MQVFYLLFSSSSLKERFLTRQSVMGGTMQFDEVEMLICTLTNSYQKRVRWANIDTLRQIAWVAVLESLKNFSSTKGSQKSYFATIIARQIRHALSKEKSPVSAGHSENLKGVIRDDIENIINTYPDFKLDPLEVLLRKECSVRVNSQLIKVVRSQSLHADMVLRILFAEATPREIAQKENVDVKILYREIHRARKALRKNKELQRMTKEFL
jgi:DNA-directed RNA polymerase specialized sigma24 family protein